MNKFKGRITRIAGTALLPAALAIGASAVPASAQQPASAQSQPAAAAHAALQSSGNRSHDGWEDTGYQFFTHEHCYRFGEEYYSDYEFACVYTHSYHHHHHDSYWELWVYYP